MPQFSRGNEVTVRDDIDEIPEEWRGKRGKVVAESVVKHIFGAREVGGVWNESNAEVFDFHQVLLERLKEAVVISDAWLRRTESWSYTSVRAPELSPLSSAAASGGLVAGPLLGPTDLWTSYGEIRVVVQ